MNVMDLVDRRDRQRGASSTLAGRRAVERAMIEEYARGKNLGEMRAQWVGLGDVSGVHIDGVNADADVFVLASAGTGPLTAAELPHVARDVFSLSLVARQRPGCRVVMLFAIRVALASAEHFVARTCGTTPIGLDVVELAATA